MFICKYCNREFTKKHSKTQHEKYYCPNNPNKQNIKKGAVYSNHKQAICKYCGESFDVATIKKHELACGNPNSKLNLKRNRLKNFSVYTTHEGLNCIYCDKICKNKNSLVQHEIRCPIFSCFLDKPIK